MQDNGNAVQTKTGSLAWNDFQNTGDGGVVAVDSNQTAHPGTSIRYSSYQFFDQFVWRTVNVNGVAGPAVPVGLNIVSGPRAGLNLHQADGGIQFYQPFVLNAVDPKRMLIGTQSPYKSFDQGGTLHNLANEFLAAGTNGSFIGGNFGFGINQGVPMAYGGRLNGVANPDVIYIGDGANFDTVGIRAQLFHRVSAGGPFTKLTAYPGDEVVTVVMDPQDYRRVYVTDISNRVWASFNEGTTWRELTANLPTLTTATFTNTIEIYSTRPSTNEDVLMVGTIGGVFQMQHPDRAGATWKQLGEDLPHALTIDLHYDYTDIILVAGTLGRGAWTISNPFSDDNSSNSAVVSSVSIAGTIPTLAAPTLSIASGSLFNPTAADGSWNSSDGKSDPVNVVKNASVQRDDLTNRLEKQIVGTKAQSENSVKPSVIGFVRREPLNTTG